MNSLLETTMNTRILGRSITAQGRGPGLLLRSDEIRHPSERDIQYLLKGQITTIIDLRGKADAAKFPSPFAHMQDFFYHNIAIEEGSSVPESVAAVPGSYLDIAGSANMAAVFRCIARAPQGVLFHCAAGKDRTGVVSAILLLFAGASVEEIVEDYMLTKECNHRRFALARKKFPHIDINIIIPREEYMLRFLQLFHDRYGSVSSYFREIGLTPEETGLLRDKLLYL